MSDHETREAVRHYAAAAAAVSAWERRHLDVVEADACCAPSAREAVAADACCESDRAVDAAFGASLYSADEQGHIPARAVAASLGCGTRRRSPSCAPASGSSTWALAAASTSCSPPGGSGPPGSPTAST